MAEEPRFVSREGWGAAEPRTPPSALRTPVEHVCFTYSTGGRACFGDDECRQVLQEIQTSYMERGSPDLPFNFLVGGDGTVYEGRGWATRPSDELGHRNRAWLPRLDIAFIGQYSRETLPKEMYFRGIDTVYHGVRNRLICKQYSFQENRQAPRYNSANPLRPDRRWSNYGLINQSMTTDATSMRKTYNATTFTGVKTSMLQAHLQ